MLDHKFSSLDVEVGTKGEIEGYASKFGIKDQGGDIVVKGAFSQSLSARMPKMLWQHDPSQPIGRWKSAEQDSTGLLVVGQINMDVQKGQEAASLIKDKAIDGMSIGYRTRKATKTKAGRELKDLDLWEVSLVTFPMLQEATVDQIKSISEMEDPAEIKRTLEAALRDVGLSKRLAMKAAADVAGMISDEREATGSEVTADDVRSILRDLRA